MRGIPRPTQWAIRKASELGAMMAKLEPAVVPDLDDVHTYSDYIQFMVAHRRKLAQLPSFAFWNGRVEELIEQERKMLGCELEESDRWKNFQSHVAGPMRCAFWYGWEQAYSLKKRYEIRLAAPPDEPEDVIDKHQLPQHPRASGITPGELLDDDPLWHMLASRLVAKVGETPEAAVR